MENKKSHPKAAQETSKSTYAELSAAAQRARLLDALRCGPITTLEARRNLDILMPGSRIHELRHVYGYRIETLLVWQKTDTGRSHRVALYVLITEKNSVDTMAVVQEAT